MSPVSEHYTETMYFSVLCLLNALHLTFTFLDTPLRPVGKNTTYITRFSEPFTAIMVSHFLIDLREADWRRMHRESFISLDSIGRLETPQSMVFYRPFSDDSIRAVIEDDETESIHSYSI
ncbi:hypothetical protein BD309DRAFT_547723 [Dichomitus squalens]|nr:hypothetical protein BD309DRAFT_547723 [Dichomitus squalens]